MYTFTLTNIETLETSTVSENNLIAVLGIDSDDKEYSKAAEIAIETGCTIALNSIICDGVTDGFDGVERLQAELVTV